MKLSNINFDRGAYFAPLSSLKCAGTGVGTLDLISSIVGMGFDTANNIYTNDTNQSIARATNQANKEINAEQLAWAREQYEMEKAENRYLVDQAYQRDIEQRENERKYNSPAMQKQRLLAAGINPTLAMYGSGGSSSAGASSAVRSQVGQNAHANQPNAIPMQTGAPMKAFTGFGQGISDAIKNYYLAKENERQDYSLASDIYFRDQENRRETRKALLEERKHLDEMSNNKRDFELQKKWIDRQMKHLDDSDLLDRNRFEHQKSYDDAQQRIDDFRARTERYRASIEDKLADSQIELNDSSISKISSEVSEIDTRVSEMIANGKSQREINDFIKKQEEVLYNKLVDEYIISHGKTEWEKNRTVLAKRIHNTIEYMLSPLRGIFGATGSVSGSITRKVP